MKNYLISYLKTALILLLAYIIASIILTTFITFIPISNTLYHVLLYLFSYCILIACSIYFYKVIPHKLLLHSCLFALGYLILSFLFHLGDLNMIAFITRPLVFIATSIVLSYFGK